MVSINHLSGGETRPNMWGSTLELVLHLLLCIFLDSYYPQTHLKALQQIHLTSTPVSGSVVWLDPLWLCFRLDEKSGSPPHCATDRGHRGRPCLDRHGALSTRRGVCALPLCIAVVLCMLLHANTCSCPDSWGTILWSSSTS